MRELLERAEIKAKEIGRKLKKGMPEGWSYFLILASNGADGFCTYLSTAQRSCAIKMLREMATHLETNGKEI